MVSLDLSNLQIKFIHYRNIFISTVIMLEGNKRPCISGCKPLNNLMTFQEQSKKSAKC